MLFKKWPSLHLSDWHDHECQHNIDQAGAVSITSRKLITLNEDGRNLETLMLTFTGQKVYMTLAFSTRNLPKRDSLCRLTVSRTF